MTTAGTKCVNGFYQSTIMIYHSFIILLPLLVKVLPVSVGSDYPRIASLDGSLLGREASCQWTIKIKIWS